MNTNKNTNTNGNRYSYDVPTYEQWLYQQAESAVTIALRARHSKTPTKLFSDLQNSYSTDNNIRNRERLSREIDTLEAESTDLRNAILNIDTLCKECNKLITNISTPQADRKQLADQLTKYRKERTRIKALLERNNSRLSELYNTIGNSYSDRADLVQVAIMQLLQNERQPAPITLSVCLQYGVNDEEELTEAELMQAQQTANFRAVINAVGRAIGTLASPEALNYTTTKAKPISDEEAAEYIRIYGSIGKDTRIPYTAKRTRASDCYITIEHRNTKTQQGYYKIYHYRTIAPYQYIEQYNSDSDNGNNSDSDSNSNSKEADASYLKSYNPFISNYSDIERIEELCNRANLTDRQRKFLEMFSRRCRVSADFSDCKDYAFKAIGITTATNRSTFFNRLKKTLNSNK